MRKLLYLLIVGGAIFSGCNKYTEKPDDITEYQEFEALITGKWKVQEMKVDSFQEMFYKYLWLAYPKDTSDTNDVYLFSSYGLDLPSFYLIKHGTYSFSDSVLHYVWGDTIENDSMFGTSMETYARKISYAVPVEFYVEFKSNHTWTLTGIKKGNAYYYYKDTLHREHYYCNDADWVVYEDSTLLSHYIPDTVVYADGVWSIINKEFIQIEGGILTGTYDISGNELVKQEYEYYTDWIPEYNYWWTDSGQQVFLYADTHIVRCQQDYGVCDVYLKHYEGPYSWQKIKSYFKMQKQ